MIVMSYQPIGSQRYDVLAEVSPDEVGGIGIDDLSYRVDADI